MFLVSILKINKFKLSNKHIPSIYVIVGVVLTSMAVVAIICLDGRPCAL